jgi:DME family drug/metabolite transporter
VLALGGSLAGTALLVLGRGAGTVTGSVALGVFFAVACAVGVAIHVMWSRSFAGRHHPLRPLAVAFPAGVIVLAPLALAGGISLSQPALGWTGVLYLAIGPSVVAYLFLQRGLREVTATTASIVTLLEPLVAAILAWIMFDERLGPAGLAGGLMLVAAIAFLSLAPAVKPRRAPLDAAGGVPG